MEALSIGNDNDLVKEKNADTLCLCSTLELSLNSAVVVLNEVQTKSTDHPASLLLSTQQ